MRSSNSSTEIKQSGAGIHLLRFLISLLFLGLLIPASLSAQDPEPVPYDFRGRQAGYFGPEGEEPEPDNLEEVLVAYFGPGDDSHPEHGGFWSALRIAEKEVNEKGGYRGIPIRVLPVWTEDPWAGGISDMVKAFYEKPV